MSRPTKTQEKVLQLMSQGLSDEEIGVALSVTKLTVRTHVHNVLRRLGVHTRAHAVAICMREGWVV